VEQCFFGGAHNQIGGDSKVEAEPKWQFHEPSTTGLITEVLDRQLVSRAPVRDDLTICARLEMSAIRGDVDFGWR
jgi:hypothetical protein